MRALDERGIRTQVHYIPVHRHPYYRAALWRDRPARRRSLLPPHPVAAAVRRHERRARRRPTWSRPSPSCYGATSREIARRARDMSERDRAPFASFRRAWHRPGCRARCSKRSARAGARACPCAAAKRLRASTTSFAPRSRGRTATPSPHSPRASAPRCSAAPERDVLARYHGAAHAAGADDRAARHQRLPADRSRDLRRGAAAARQRSEPTMPPTTCRRSWPHGLDCEAFTHRGARRRRPRPRPRRKTASTSRPGSAATAPFAASTSPARAARSTTQRWTLDYPEDLAFLRAVFDRLPRAEGAPAGATSPGSSRASRNCRSSTKSRRQR